MNKLQSETEERLIKEIKAFLKTDAWNEYLLPMLMASVQKELPPPSEKGWQEKYRNAFALSSAISLIINSLKNTASKDEFLKRVKMFYESGIDEV
jgi:tRNA nucleotidyltransferase/poly(A) polymerase